MRRTRKVKGTKTVSYQLIRFEDPRGEAMYQMLDALVRAHHEDLSHARFALAWCTSWRPDVDGRIILGKCKKASDLDRELVAYDFIVLLSQAFWTDLLVTDEQRRALMDHELMHAAVKYDKNGQPEFDERGRRVYRVRKHDLEEFVDIVDRHGLYKRDLERFYAAVRRTALAGFVPCEQCQQSPGWVAEAPGAPAVKRCPCFLAWQARLGIVPKELQPA